MEWHDSIIINMDVLTLIKNWQHINILVAFNIPLLRNDLFQIVDYRTRISYPVPISKLQSRLSFTVVTNKTLSLFKQESRPWVYDLTKFGPCSALIMHLILFPKPCVSFETERTSPTSSKNYPPPASMPQTTWMKPTESAPMCLQVSTWISCGLKRASMMGCTSIALLAQGSGKEPEVIYKRHYSPFPRFQSVTTSQALLKACFSSRFS